MPSFSQPDLPTGKPRPSIMAKQGSYPSLRSRIRSLWQVCFCQVNTESTPYLRVVGGMGLNIWKPAERQRLCGTAPGAIPRMLQNWAIWGPATTIPTRKVENQVIKALTLEVLSVRKTPHRWHAGSNRNQWNWSLWHLHATHKFEKWILDHLQGGKDANSIYAHAWPRFKKATKRCLYLIPTSWFPMHTSCLWNLICTHNSCNKA